MYSLLPFFFLIFQKGAAEVSVLQTNLNYSLLLNVIWQTLPPNCSPTSKLQVPHNQGQRSIFDLFFFFFFFFWWWFGGGYSVKCPLWMHGGCLRGDCPLRSWKILYFWNWNCAIRWILLGTNLGQAIGKKTTTANSSMDLTDPNLHFGRNCG